MAGVVGEDNASDCAVLSSGGVDCWGSGNLHETGNSFDADAPIPVSGVGGIGTFSGAVSAAATAAGLGAEGSTVCAVLTSGGVDCWYGGRWGTLGNGLTSTSAVPVRVVDTTGTGTLSGVVAVQGGEYDHSFCATLTSGRVACWGYGETGEMGNGTEFQTNDVPVYVKIPSVNTAPAFTADSPPTTATAGDPYSYTFSASGTPAPTYSLSGQPGWLSINSSSGALSGTVPAGTMSSATR